MAVRVPSQDCVDSDVCDTVAGAVSPSGSSTSTAAGGTVEVNHQGGSLFKHGAQRIASVVCRFILGGCRRVQALRCFVPVPVGRAEDSARAMFQPAAAAAAALAAIDDGEPVVPDLHSERINDDEAFVIDPKFESEPIRLVGGWMLTLSPCKV